MKNTPKKVNEKSSKTAKTNAVKCETPTFELNIKYIYTDDHMVEAIAQAKLNAGQMLYASEVQCLLANAAEMFDKLSEFEVKMNSKLTCELFKTRVELNWAKRPWYKKLMFWKKPPVVKCYC